MNSLTIAGSRWSLDSVFRHSSTPTSCVLGAEHGGDMQYSHSITHMQHLPTHCDMRHNHLTFFLFVCFVLGGVKIVIDIEIRLLAQP